MARVRTQTGKMSALNLQPAMAISRLPQFAVRSIWTTSRLDPCSAVRRGFVIGIAVAALLSAGGVAASTLTATPDFVAFGKVRVGTTAQITLDEVDGETTTSLLITIDDDLNFALLNVPSAVPANGSAAFDLECVSAGANSATITVSWSAPAGQLNIPVDCDAPAMWIATPADPFNFHGQEVGITSAAQSFTISNDSGASAQVTDLAMTGSHCAGFPLDSAALPISLAAGANTTVMVAFAPSFRGEHSCTLNVVDSVVNIADNSLGLIGTGQGASIALAPNETITFPDQVIGTSSSPLTLTITNTGDPGYDLDVTGISTSGDAASDFTPAGFTSGVIAHGASAEVSVTFTPSIAGMRAATLTVDTSEPLELSASIDATGNGVADPQLIHRSGFE